MSRDVSTDVLILGAGPAGCAAAISARQRGLRVLMLEARPRPGIVPGETLHPGVEPLLARLGMRDAVLAAGFHRHRGIWTAWDGPRRFIAYGADDDGPWRGFQADRARLHAILIDAAQAAGATLLRPVAPTGILRSGQAVAGVRTADKAINATDVLDATGHHAWLARALNLAPTYFSPPLRLRFGWRDAAADDDPEEPAIDARPAGWDWRAPLGSGRVAWVTLRANATSQAATSFRWRLYEDCAGPGYMLLGDAGALLDPASSHGVLRALMSGMLAAHLIAVRQQGLLAADAATDNYRRWVHEQFSNDVAALRALYARHPDPPTRLALCGAT
jgi:flavin-dependent dehydrogenase